MSVNIIQGNMIPVQTTSSPIGMSDTQKQTVASILSGYDASSLTTKDARAINDAFRDAGFKRGAALANAVEAAGFDGGQISVLDPPPPEKVGGIGPAGNDHDYFSLNTDVLEQLKGILENYNFNELTPVQEDEMVKKLENAGLLFPGLVVNTMV